jgi:hypothetical protein
MVEAIADALGMAGRAEGWPIEEAIRAWGDARARFSLGSNCRVRGRRARELLGWSPRPGSVVEAIRRDLRQA